MSILDYYLLAINGIGFLAYLINMLLYRYTEKGQIDKALTVISLLGGSLGIILCILVLDRIPKKDNMMSRVFVACVFVIQVILLLLLKGFHADYISLAFWDFFANKKILLFYLVIINCVTFVIYAIDKVNAAEKKRKRYKIITLLGLAFIGGSLGAILAMYLLHHKTKKDYFTVGVPLIMVMQVFVLFYLMNIGW